MLLGEGNEKCDFQMITLYTIHDPLLMQKSVLVPRSLVYSAAKKSTFTEMPVA